MNTSERKQKELADREEKILVAARKMLLTDGYHGLSMDRIAQNLQYSKGTIYNHFSCKEEIIIALATETMEIRVSLFRRGATFRGSARERLMALGVASELFYRLFPDHFVFEQIIRLDSVWEKTSEKRRSFCMKCEQSCMEIASALVREAVSRDEISLPEGTTPEDIIFGLWAMTVGAYSIMSTSESLVGLGVMHPAEVVNRHLEMVLDGYGWKPLSTDIDYSKARQKILAEVYPDELRSIQS